MSTDCQVNAYSSAMCSRGTKGCTVDHDYEQSLARLRAALEDAKIWRVAKPMLPYEWPSKSCPCGDVQCIECLENGCVWENDPALVPERLRIPHVKRIRLSVTVPTADLDALLAERDALKADAERLDWLERHALGDVTICVPGNHGGTASAWLVAVETGEHDRWGPFCSEAEGDTLRAAIDAAMKPQGSE